MPGLSQPLLVQAQIVLIAALDRARAIGRGNVLPWHLPDDLKRFKALTTGKTILMGRKTFEGIGRPLPKRRNLVLSRDPSFQAEGAEVIDLEAVQAIKGELCVIGGGEVYALFLPLAARMNLTLIDTLVEDADAFFPSWSAPEWRETLRLVHDVDGRHEFRFEWLDLERA